MATSTVSGIASRNASISSPVGHRAGRVVRRAQEDQPGPAVSRPRPWREGRGRGSPRPEPGTGVAPTTWVMIGYASNDRQPNSTSSPASQVACTSCWHSATEPHPTATFSRSAPTCAASASVSRAAVLSGYRLMPAAPAADGVGDGRGHRRQRGEGHLVAGQLDRAGHAAARCVGGQPVERLADVHRHRCGPPFARGYRRRPKRSRAGRPGLGATVDPSRVVVPPRVRTVRADPAWSSASRSDRATARGVARPALEVRNNPPPRPGSGCRGCACGAECPALDS